jgi:hypothetical protein
MQEAAAPGRERTAARLQLGQQRPLTAAGKNDCFAAMAGSRWQDAQFTLSAPRPAAERRDL